jgi:hypothetical protein
MEYVIVALIVVLLVGGFGMLLVFNATRRADVSDADDPRPQQMLRGEPDSPVGDTREHAGEQTTTGETVGGQDAERHGGTGQPVEDGYAGTSGVGSGRERDPEHVGRPVVGGEGEGERRVD